MILIPVEIKSRGLHARLLLAIQLQKLGYKVLIGRKAEIQRIALLMSNYIYVGLTFSKNLENFYQQVKSKNGKLVLLDEEGLITLGIPWYSKLKCSINNFELADLIILWGNNHFNYATYNISEKEILKKFKKVGNPRFDNYFITNKLKSFKKNKNIKEHILFMSSFASLFHFKSNKRYIEELKTKKVINDYDSEKFYINYQKYKKESLKNFSAIIKNLNLEENYTISIRPHPSENILLLTKFLKDNGIDTNKININNDIDLHSQILSSDYIVHDYCTTGLESALMNKPTLYFKNPLFKKLNIPIDPYICSMSFANYDQFQALLKKCKKKSKNFSYRSNAKKQIKSKKIISTFNSAKIISSLINENIKNKKSFYIKIKNCFIIFFYFLYLKITNKKRVKNKYIQKKFSLLNYEDNIFYNKMTKLYKIRSGFSYLDKYMCFLSNSNK